MAYQSSAGRRGDTVFVIDEEGDMAVLLLRVGDDAPAWANWSTGGPESRVLGATAPLGEAGFLVERNGEVALETLAPVGEERLDAEVALAPGGTLPAWMEGLDQDVLAVREPGDGTIAAGEDVDLPFTISEGRPVFVLGDDDVPPPDTAMLRVGLRFHRLVETVQFVKRTQTGTSGRVRPARVLDAAVDYVAALPEQATDEETEAMKGVTCTITAVRRSGSRNRRLNGRDPKPASGRIYSVRYPCRLGWRDRVAIELRSDRHVEIAGLAYRAAA